MHTASYEFLIKPKELAGYHQTLSTWVGSGDKTMFSKVFSDKLHVCVLVVGYIGCQL